MKSSIGDAILEMIYPRRCPVCDGAVPFRKGLICRGCEDKLKPVKEPVCRKCGRQLLSENEEYCMDCKSVSHFFDRCITTFLYDDLMQGSVFRFKYAKRKEYAQFFAQSMCELHGKEVKELRPDVLIPVPLHRSRQEKRGFNQAEALASELALGLDIPVKNDLVKRVKNTAPQKMMSREERRKNLKKAFQLTSCDVKLKRVIVIDDIYTTGSTLDEIAVLLKGAGVHEVYGFTLCSGTPL